MPIIFANQKQQCQVIRLLLAALHLEHLWTAKGPTQQARSLLQSSMLPPREQALLRCAFDLWGGQGKLSFYGDILGHFDVACTLLLFTLLIAIHAGHNAVDIWIANNPQNHLLRKKAK